MRGADVLIKECKGRAAIVGPFTCQHASPDRRLLLFHSPGQEFLLIWQQRHEQFWARLHRLLHLLGR